MEFLLIFLGCLAAVYAATLYLGRKRAVKREQGSSDSVEYTEAWNWPKEVGPKAETHLGKEQVGRRAA